MTGFDVVWQRISALEGEVFRQNTGRPFTYVVTNGGVLPSTVNRLLGRSQFLKAYERSPLRGPGALQDLQGPSYLYAILTDPRVTSTAPVQNAVARPARAPEVRKPTVPTAEVAKPTARTGHPVPLTELTDLGFQPFDVRIERVDVPVAGGLGCEWRTVGDVPDAPGLYAFTLREDEDRDGVRVVYVGMTEHLWMVTKGFLPRGAGARGGQRYGRPAHAGRTRQRVNMEIRSANTAGWTVQHWVRPYQDPVGTRDEIRAHLRLDEEVLISRWDLRQQGWNRG